MTTEMRYGGRADRIHRLAPAPDALLPLGVHQVRPAVTRRPLGPKLEGECRLLRIFVGESDTWQGTPLYQAIVRTLRAQGIAGATVIRAIDGYGAKSYRFEPSGDVPLVIEVVDRADSIERVLPGVLEMVTEGLVTLESVQVLAYRAGPLRAPAA
ncbi:MAG TPA: DUF190 domain-containing protein [Acidimicrobiales bacterium]|nr:DUF190 domain-containing protein [Acidimicrobiales bacterium]